MKLFSSTQTVTTIPILPYEQAESKGHLLPNWPYRMVNMFAFILMVFFQILLIN